jgi:hypothetical protein
MKTIHKGEIPPQGFERCFVGAEMRTFEIFVVVIERNFSSSLHGPKVAVETP